jgi:hypothetical protein
MLEVVVLSRHDCHLCDVAMRIAEAVRSEIPFTLTRMNIDEHADLAARYETRIPVVLINQVEVLSGRITEGDFRRAIQNAGRKGLFARISSFFRMFNWGGNP